IKSTTEPKTEPVEASNTIADETASFSLPDEDRQALEEIIGEEAVTKILNLYLTISAPDYNIRNGPRPAPINTSKIDNKESRTAFHRHIRRIFNGRLETTTLED